ncbi:NAD-dependent glycerol-3-phosphate dehydrogenase [Helicosporidium sp. ATCC 50920]|nr:NAD-dependent glycerol-3-phosphate dehydrogenase [Helicosporidium sp. ATCC 50920]|eukprot:KDD75318.1 NAD-dependent glycerol-3-phosphate dehydrogenase [Helicosporidium sp. ATCC 50920]
MPESFLSSERTKVSVIGGGAFGTALAAHAAGMGHDTLLWARETEVVEAVNGVHENTVFLKGPKLPEALRATGDLEAAVTHGELVLTVIPTPFLAATLKSVSHLLRGDQILVSCTKGISNDALQTPDQILKGVLPPQIRHRLAFISGPSFAAEVARGIPTAVTVASHDEEIAQRVQTLFSSKRFRCYRTTDVVGVELAGALKNVLAIACGISDGLGFGANGRAALITRGLDEITRLAVAAGGNPLTLAGLAGVGDIVLTCTGDASRNRSVGLRLGKGEKLQAVIDSMNGMVAEGVLTSRAAHNFAQKMGVECPVLEGIYMVVNENADPLRVVEDNMSRPLKPEVSREVSKAVSKVA